MMLGSYRERKRERGTERERELERERGTDRTERTHTEKEEMKGRRLYVDLASCTGTTK